MGKKTKLREAQRARATEAISAVLAAHSKRSAYPALVTRVDDFKPDYHAKLRPFLGVALRTPAKWRCCIKSRCERERFFDLVTFLFAAYPVPAHLASVWAPGHDAGYLPLPDMRDWYLIAGRGESLYECAAHPYLSRIETHHFLTAPREVTSTQRAFWYACARAATGNVGVALDVAASRLAENRITSSFWKEAARFFARQSATAPEMNELIEFLDVVRDDEPEFSFKGRGLGALQRRANDWRHEQRARNAGCDGEWAGYPLPNIDYTFGQEPNTASWRLRQIKTGLGLFLEGERMRHCVATYHSYCMSGRTSIWSLSEEPKPGRTARAVTIELQSDGEIGQCRGFANRTPDADEIAVIRHWANEHGLDW